MAAISIKSLKRQWVGRLSAYRTHRNDEHLDALIDEAARYTGIHLEGDLADSVYWFEAPLARRVAVLLFLVDRRIVDRVVRNGRVSYIPHSHADAWVLSHQALNPYQKPTLELLGALRNAHRRQTADY